MILKIYKFHILPKIIVNRYGWQICWIKWMI